MKDFFIHAVVERIVQTVFVVLAIITLVTISVTVILHGVAHETSKTITLDVNKWSCDALDPADGQCAIYVKNH